MGVIVRTMMMMMTRMAMAVVVIVPLMPAMIVLSVVHMAAMVMILIMLVRVAVIPCMGMGLTHCDSDWRPAHASCLPRCVTSLENTSVLGISAAAVTLFQGLSACRVMTGPASPAGRAMPSVTCNLQTVDN
jgi:hypothetical protein